MRRGSVILEFVLMMPVLLLLFGGTLLTYEIIAGKLRLQESNRNLAWLGADAYGVSNAYVERLAKSYFNDRNSRERKIDGDSDLWGSFGGGPYNIVRKQFADDFYNGVTPWSSMIVGNMVVKMEKVSAAYMGAIAVSSVLHGDGEDDGKPFYSASYDISHTADPGDDGDLAGEDFSPESYVLRRRAENDNGANEAEYRKDKYIEDVWRISLEAWPKRESESMSAPPQGTAAAQEYKRYLYDYTQ